MPLPYLFTAGCCVRFIFSREGGHIFVHREIIKLYSPLNSKLSYSIELYYLVTWLFEVDKIRKVFGDYWMVCNFCRSLREASLRFEIVLQSLYRNNWQMMHVAFLWLATEVTDPFCQYAYKNFVYSIGGNTQRRKYFAVGLSSHFTWEFIKCPLFCRKSFWKSDNK